MPYDNRDPKRDHNFDNHPYEYPPEAATVGVRPTKQPYPPEAATVGVKTAAILLSLGVEGLGV